MSPCLDSDEELVCTLSVLMSIIGEYTGHLRAVLNELATTEAEEGEPA